MRIRGSVRRRASNTAGYLFISPWLIGFFCFTLIPVGASFYLAFTRYEIVSSPKWVWFDNFIRMFTNDYRYKSALKATFYYVFTAVPLRLVTALAVAMLLQKSTKLISVSRAVYYLPSIVGGSVAVAVMWRQIFGRTGLVNALLGFVGITGPNWLGNPKTAIWTLIVLAAWQFGSPMLILLAGLKQIPQSLYEAAAIDGAGGWRRFCSITLPMLSPVIFFNLVMQIINGFMVFTQAYIITGGRPLDTTLFYTLYLYQKGFRDFEMGYASAMAWFLLVIIAFFTLLAFRSSSFWVYYESKERE
jgi:multiple sugar transport system permease protein